MNGVIMVNCTKWADLKQKSCKGEEGPIGQSLWPFKVLWFMCRAWISKCS